MKRIFLALIFILSWSICIAGVPHILKNGEIVDANQLNANFEYLIKLTELDATSWYPTYANGILIGKSNISANAVSLTFNSDFEPVYLLKNGEIKFSNNNIQFTEPDCTGDRYIIFSDYPTPENDFLIANPKGGIYKDQSSGELYYYPPKVQTMYAKIPLSYQYSDGTICHHDNFTGYYLTGIEDGEVAGFANLQGDGWRESTQEEIDIFLSKIMIQLLPNDPAITGLSNMPFLTPITFDGITEAVIQE